MYRAEFLYYFKKFSNTKLPTYFLKKKKLPTYMFTHCKELFLTTSFNIHFFIE